MSVMALKAEFGDGLARTWKWMMALGIFLMLVGAVAIIAPAAASVTIAVLIGWVFLIAGVFQFASSFSVGSGGQMAMRALVGLLGIVAGLYILLAPLDGTLTLTFVMGAFFLASGVFNLAGGVAMRGSKSASSLALSGVLSMIIGVLVLADLPSSSAWAIGLLAGINFIFDGFALMAVGMAGREAMCPPPAVRFR